MTCRFLTRSADTEPTEIHLGLLSFLWGVWLLSPYWSVFDTVPAMYQAFGQLMPEGVWGGLFTVIGVSKLIGVRYRVNWLRMISAILGASAWAFATVAFVTVDIRFLSSVMHSVPILANAWVYLRLRKGVRCQT